MKHYFYLVMLLTGLTVVSCTSPTDKAKSYCDDLKEACVKEDLQQVLKTREEIMEWYKSLEGEDREEADSSLVKFTGKCLNVALSGTDDIMKKSPEDIKEKSTELRQAVQVDNILSMDIDAQLDSMEAYAKKYEEIIKAGDNKLIDSEQLKEEKKEYARFYHAIHASLNSDSWDFDHDPKKGQVPLTKAQQDRFKALDDQYTIW